MDEPLASNWIADVLDRYWGLNARAYGDVLHLYGDHHYPYGLYEIPTKPTILVANDTEDSDNTQRFDLQNKGDLIVLRLGPAGWSEEFVGYPLEFKIQKARIQLEMYTKTNRQNLYNLMREARRLCYVHRKRVLWRLDFSAPSGTWTMYEKITGTTSGVTANIGYYDNTKLYMWIDNHSGWFQKGEVITGFVSGRTATVTREQYSWWQLLRYESFNESTESTFNSWIGTIMCSLENAGIGIVLGYSE